MMTDATTGPMACPYCGRKIASTDVSFPKDFLTEDDEMSTDFDCPSGACPGLVATFDIVTHELVAIEKLSI